jgi:hypothetical protein
MENDYTKEDLIKSINDFKRKNNPPLRWYEKYFFFFLIYKLFQK